MSAHPSQMHNLTTLIKRLEAATSRLEDIASIPSYPASSSTTQHIPGGESAGSTIVGVPPSQPPVVEELPSVIEEFDELIAGPVAMYLEKSKALPNQSLVVEQSKAVEKCFAAQRKFLLITTKARKPEGSSQFMELLTSMQREWANISNLSESNRASPCIEYLSATSEAIASLTWVATDTPPAKFIGEICAAAQYYGNRILVKKDPLSTEWVRSVYKWVEALQAFTKKWYPAGLTWNAKGVDAKEALAALDGTPPSISGFSGGAPPPPPPPLPNLPPVDGSNSPTADPVSSVFAAINRGSDVTAGLRKVNKEEMTHKNPSLRASSVVPAARPGSSGSLRGKSPAPPTRAKPAGLSMKKPPKKELDGNKWLIENYENESALILDNVEINQSVFVFRCKNTVIQINGKINAVSINECTKTGVIVDNLVSSIDIIKSNSFSIQINGSAPTVQVDQCDGGTIYLSKTNTDIEVLTSKSTAINIDIPHQTADGSDEWDYAEKPVPEQLRHTVKGGQLKSEIVEHAG